MVTAIDGFDAAHWKRIVVKIGSSLLVDKDGRIREDWISTVVEDIAERHAAGQRVIIVSSGAIALGARRLALAKGGRSCVEDAQAAAAVGQIALSHKWAELLAAKGLTAAQILVTLDDLEHRRRYLNASATLERLLGLGVVPVVNENDSVATEEIRFGDNDRLAARIAQAADASAVVLLSDIDGLYTANPHKYPDATLVEHVEAITDDIIAMADGGSSSGMGSGGMVSKIEAAKIANSAGISLAIISGHKDHPLTAFAQSGHGTVFHSGSNQGARKKWLAGRLTIRGHITVDAGAAKALIAGNSLLPAGVRAVTGTFARGDAVDILTDDGRILARGLSEYDSGDAVKIIGCRSEEIARILGSVSRSVMVHRDHMVML
ncbi:glutamate 5-kinase [Rhizorhapis sp. SPR117]|uniref:glutamate 5-kinase n=1 Tax=Rhizorhapis sp. SPR117 TaxID=2912611 RepID=UPI001F031583|nr:glutamate 5-kinase [Rhizorhapis sp. SPR117]